MEITKKQFIPAIFIVIVSSLMLVGIIYAFFIDTDQFLQKLVVVSVAYTVLLVMFFFLNLLTSLSILIFFIFFNLPVYSYGTTSMNLLILTFLGAHIIRAIVQKKKKFFNLFFQNHLSLPLGLVFSVYLLSILFIKKSALMHFTMIQTILCGIILIALIIEFVDSPEALDKINKVLLIGLLINLAFSLICVVLPSIEVLRANIMSMTVLTGEKATRLAGLSFRGEAYGEYLMMCSLVLSVLFIAKNNKFKCFIGPVLLTCILIMILNKTRGAFVCYAAGLMLILLFTNRKKVISKSFIIFAMFSFLLFIFYYISFVDTSREETIIDRFAKLGEKQVMIGYIPKDRFYTWAPSFRIAEQAKWLGVGPSFLPHTIYENPMNYVTISGIGKIGVSWPHNIYILILGTVGIQGLLVYTFFLWRILRMYRFSKYMDDGISCYYTGYFIAFLMFLVEAFKFDGALRHSHGTFYLLALTIGLMATAQTIREKQNFALKSD